MKKGRYRLVQEYNETGERAYFNFGARQFYDQSEKGNQQVSLATIDSITTVFTSEKEFIYMLRNSGFDPSISTLFISYNLKGERKLAPVFNDEMLKRVSDCTLGRQDGKVDVEKAFISDYLNNIFRVLIVPNNGLYKRIADKYAKGSNTYGVNKMNYYFIGNLDHVFDGKVEDERFWFERFKHEFSDYKEFRALHLNYVAYQKQLAKQRQANGYAYQIGEKK